MIPAAGLRQLTAMTDKELLAVVGSLPVASEQRQLACGLLVARYRGLVRSCVQRYSPIADSAEDLLQVGYVGLLKAINNFDPSFDLTLAAYARPCITGEIKRYFRDGRWQIHVTRTVKELAAEIRTATPRLSQQLGRTPADSDLAQYLGVSDAALREAHLAEMAFRPTSLDASAGPGVKIGDLLGREDPRIEHVLGMQSVAAHWHELPAREQKVLFLRFYEGLTQVQIGEQLGVSQMQVSRLIAHALGYLRPRLFGAQGADCEITAGYRKEPGKRMVKETLRTQARVPA